jgi:hypothetical protein
VVGIFLLIDVNEAGFRPSASRGVNAVASGIIPEVVDTDDTLEPRNLIAGLGIHDRQHRWVATAAEKPMMGLIERQRDNTRNSRQGPSCNCSRFSRSTTPTLDRPALGVQDLEVMNGKAVIEIKPTIFSKGEAVREMMKNPPFAYRKPIFVGDDTTDESVFKVLPMLGGAGYSVERLISGAKGTFDSPYDVRCWLARLCGRAESNWR